MPSEDLIARLRATGGRQFARTLHGGERAVRGLGRAHRSAARDARLMNAAGRGVIGGLRGLGTGALYAGAAIGGGLIYEAKRSVSAFEEQRQILETTEARLKSTGGAAGVAERDIARTSDRLSEMAGIDDEEIRKLQNRLLTFPTIRKPVFERAALASLDLAAEKEMSAAAAGEQLAKALAQPTKGYSRLQRAGVVFTDQQVAQITALEKSGDLLGAQGVILRTVEEQYGGTAKAQRTPLKALGVAVGNVEEAIGKGLSPVVDAGAEKLTRFAKRVLPMVERSAEGIVQLFEDRDDLDFGAKLGASADIAKTWFRPLITEAHAELDRLNIGDRIATGIEEAAPRIADAAARQAPRFIMGFGRAFANAGPGGQLLTAAMITAKLGGFSAGGGWAARKLAGAFKTQLGIGVAEQAITAAGTTAAGDAAQGFVSPASKSRFGKAGQSMGKVLGRGMAVGAALGVGMLAANILQEIEDQLRGEGEIGNKIADSLYTNPVTGGLSILNDIIGTDQNEAPNVGPRVGNRNKAGPPKPPSSPRSRIIPRGPSGAPTSSMGGQMTGPPEGWWRPEIVVKVGERELLRAAASGSAKEARRA